MEGNQQKIREALTKLVAYLEKEVRRTAKCKRCEFNGKSFHGEPCYWHVDCGIDQNDDEASDNAMYLLKKFKLREALSEPPRNCDIYTTSEDADRAITEYCSKMAETGECVKSCPYREAEGGCAFGWILATAAERKGEVV